MTEATSFAMLLTGEGPPACVRDHRQQFLNIRDKPGNPLSTPSHRSYVLHPCASKYNIGSRVSVFGLVTSNRLPHGEPHERSANERCPRCRPKPSSKIETPIIPSRVPSLGFHRFDSLFVWPRVRPELKLGGKLSSHSGLPYALLSS
jgi:hypothetical protein